MEETNFYLRTVRHGPRGEGVRGFFDDSTETTDVLFLKSVTVVTGGSKTIWNCVTSFMDDPLSLIWHILDILLIFIIFMTNNFETRVHAHTHTRVRQLLLVTDQTQIIASSLNQKKRINKICFSLDSKTSKFIKRY